MNKLTLLLALLVPSLAWAAPSAGPPQPPQATYATLTTGGCFAGSDMIWRITDCTTVACVAGGGATHQLVQCSGVANSFNVVRDGAAGAGDGVPAGVGHELNFRKDATTFDAVT